MIRFRRKWSKRATFQRGAEKAVPGQIFQIRWKSTTTILWNMAKEE